MKKRTSAKTLMAAAALVSILATGFANAEQRRSAVTERINARQASAPVQPRRIQVSHRMMKKALTLSNILAGPFAPFGLAVKAETKKTR